MQLVQRSGWEQHDHYVDNDDDGDVDNNDVDNEDGKHLEVSLDVHLLQLLLALQRESVERLGVCDAHLRLVLQEDIIEICVVVSPPFLRVGRVWRKRRIFEKLSVSGRRFVPSQLHHHPAQ